MATQIDEIGVIHLTIAIRREIKVFDIKMMVKVMPLKKNSNLADFLGSTT